MSIRSGSSSPDQRFSTIRSFFNMTMDIKKAEKIAQAVEKFVPCLDEELIEALELLRQEAA